MEEDWGPWIEHDGGPCTCVGSVAQAWWENGTVDEPSIVEGNPEAWVWDYRPDKFFKIVSYRIRKPKGLKLLQEIAANPPKQPIRERRPERIIG